MLYHYYMKINFKLLLSAALMISLFPGALAQVTVVKLDGQKIYLDTTELNRNVSIGDSFKIITGQERLTNPKTGKDLGLVYHYSPEGKIIEVQPMYAVGELPQKGDYTVGQEAVINAQPQTVAMAAASAATAEDAKQNAPQSQVKKALVANRKIQTYPVIDREVISAVKADLNALPGEEFAVVDTKGNLVLYTQDNNALRQIAQYKLSGGKQFLSLSAQDVTGAGHAQLFAAVYSPKDQRIFTLVFDVTDNQFKEIASMAYFAKEMGCGADKKIYVQKPFTSGVKAGDVRELAYKKGRFSAGKKITSSRGNWLTGINYFPLENDTENNFIYTASNGTLRLRLDNGKFADSPALFATAPNRVKYKQEIISFYPSVQAYDSNGRAVLAGVQNMTEFGILSESFGSYKSGKIHFLTYENGVLDVRETVDLNGFVYDTTCTDLGILAPQVVSGGKTVLTEIYR